MSKAPRPPELPAPRATPTPGSESPSGKSDSSGNPNPTADSEALPIAPIRGTGSVPRRSENATQNDTSYTLLDLAGHKQEATGPSNPPLHYPIPPLEEDRIARLLGFEILDTESDHSLDRLTTLAALICDVPVALISLVDRHRQWFKSVYGLPIRETSRDVSFCAHAIMNPEKPFIVSDTTKDKRFATNPLVTGFPYIRFYAGSPLLTEDRIPLGTFCVIDYKPKELTPFQLESLKQLSEIAMDFITIHKSNTKLSRLIHLEKEVYSRLLRSSADLATTAPTFDEALHFLLTHLDENLGWLSARFRNMQNGKTTGIIFNTLLPSDPELPSLWQVIDSTPQSAAELHSHSRFVSTAPLKPEYSYLTVPVRIRNRLVALIELIYPDHRKMDKRIQEIFDLLASNLAIVAERELVLIDLKFQATHDQLTGAANRNVILQSIERALRESDRLVPDSVLLFFDIDGFKDVNDNFGHETGDRLLVEIASRLNSVCRSNDVLGRLSGDEFILLARGIDTEKGIIPLLERIHRTISATIIIGDFEIRVQASIGCVVLSDPYLPTNEVIRRAEEAMYLVKTGEKQNFCIADKEVVESFHQKKSMNRTVRDAFENNRVFSVYQPIVDIQSKNIAGFEALIRLLKKDGSVMEAYEFMEAIIRSRYLPRLDDYVMTETLQTFRSEMARHYLKIPGFRFSVNIGPAILSSKNYATNCLAQIEKAGLSPRNLTIEVIESKVLEPSEVVVSNLKLLREEGAFIALDDFGTGYSNLQQLSRIPVDIIKIDKVFLKEVTYEDQKKPSPLLNAIMELGRNMGYEIIVEGVESKTQEDYLLSHGCRYAQGYYYGKPMPMSHWFSESTSMDEPGQKVKSFGEKPKDYPGFSPAASPENSSP